MPRKKRPREHIIADLSVNYVERLYESGYTRDNIFQLFGLIDWMMALPKDLELMFDTEINRYEEEKKMPYITSVERGVSMKLVFKRLQLWL
jgi:hypothetical protein